MKKLLLTIISFCFAIGQYASAQSYSGAESVEFDFANNRYLVSNTSSKQIIARASNGTLSVFATCATAPYGIEIFGDTLYCCTSGSITGIQLSSGSIIFNKPITGSQFINGITHDPSGILYITDFNGLKVYKFNTSNRQITTFVNNTITKPNGIIYDPYDGINPRLVMVSWAGNAAIRAIDIANSTLTTLTTTTFSNIDGIAKGKNGQFYISCWGNSSIIRYDSTFMNTPTVMASGISSPADIYYNQVTDTLAVPFGSNVNFYFFGTLTGQNTLLNNSSIQIFPNPSNGIFNIISDGKINNTTYAKLYELASGKLIYAANLGNFKNNTSINLSNQDINSGMYILELSSNEGIISRSKVIFE